MGLLSSTIFESFYFYTFSVFITLCGGVTVGWASTIVLEIENIDGTWSWKNDAVLSLVVLIIINICLCIIAVLGGVFSIKYFNNAKFRNQSTIIFRITTTFAVLFVIIMFLQCAIQIYAMIELPSPQGDFAEAFKNYLSQTEDKMFVDDVQDELSCCGIESYRDYKEILNSPIPGSCCDNLRRTCTVDDIKDRSGCASSINVNRYTLAYRINFMFLFILIITLIEIGSFFCALGLIKSRRIRKAKKNQVTQVTYGYKTTKIFVISS